MDAWGRISYTDGDAYSGDNSRAVIKADNWLYYSVGNDNSGGLSKKQVPETQLGFNLSHSTGAELFVPGAAPLVPPDNNMISYFVFFGRQARQGHELPRHDDLRQHAVCRKGQRR